MPVRYLLILSITLASCTGVVSEYHKVLEEAKTSKQSFNQSYIAYTGDSLRNIAFPLGGIGTGNLLLSGRGNIMELEIFGMAAQDEVPPEMNFFILRTESPDGTSDLRMLEGEPEINYPNPFGIPRTQLGGIPRFRKCSFIAGFPIARLRLKDPACPLEASLLAYNPLIPLDTGNSSLPMAIFEWTLSNPGNDTIRASVLFSSGNPFKIYNNTGELQGRTGPFSTAGMKGVKFTSISPEEGDYIICGSANAMINTKWYRGNWWDNAELFLKEFSMNGKLPENLESYSFGSRDSDVASVSQQMTLAPGDTLTIPFYVFWRLPVRNIGTSMALDAAGKTSGTIKNHYARRFSSATEVAFYFEKNWNRLRELTLNFHDLLFSSTYPDFVKDALASNTAGLKTNLILIAEDGTVHGFEGLGNDFGCCPGNCTHVWNYAQTMAFLFPSLERNMRETSFLHDTHRNGYQSFRSIIPKGNYWFKNHAADGQLGSIIRVYRDWKYSGNDEWMISLWPKVKLALEFTWKGAGEVRPGFEWMKSARVPWDTRGTGVIDGDQHNTYDINFFGPNMLTGSLYLGALLASSEMATVAGDVQKADEYRERYLASKEIYEKLLWNGEYYEQKVEIAPGINLPERYSMTSPDGQTVPKYQFGPGCLSDQLLGQFLADVSGLPALLDSSRINQTLSSVHRYNFIRDFSKYPHVQRIYATGKEAGLVLCTWPRGGKPDVPFVYSDEVWTGVEYQVAASLIYHGMADKGLEIVKATRDRYRGYNRNPLAEIESGRYYARAMSSWALLTSLSGYKYDGHLKSLSFRPAIHAEKFNTFWSTGNAWGSFSIQGKSVSLKVFYGELQLNEFSFSHPTGGKILEIKPPLEMITVIDLKKVLKFTVPLILKEGESLEMVLE